MDKKYLVAAMAAPLILTACQDKVREDSADSKVTKVKIMQVQSSPQTLSRKYSGTVEESTGTSLSFSVPGTVNKVYIKNGDRVAKGQIIASVDTTVIKSSYNAAKAALDQAQDAYNRLKLLHDEKSLADIKWVDIQSKLQQAKAMERMAEKNLRDCYLRAPFGGVIAEKKMETGQNVMPGIPVAKIVAMQQVKVKVSVPEDDIKDIKIGDKAMLSVLSAGEGFIEGSVVEKSVVANPLSRSYEVKVAVDNKDDMLLPGMVTDTYIIGGEGAECIILPANVVQIDENNNSFVWVNEGGKAGKRVITCGEYSAGGVMIDKGLSGGDEIIISGQQKVSEGSAITF
ncbi:MAG: efflux RND transporter periplasmic adaptor subunit [Phocaeicola sp.]|nr:efflux RND transporter periplasmic adaptor subunit [Phocaeicola sp.]